MNKRKVLVMVDWYAPGFKAGGPIRSAVNFADHLENDLDIFVLTTNRDLNESMPYKGVVCDKWVQYNAHHVFYTTPDALKWEKLKSIIFEINPDYIYLNSMFSKYFTIYPLLLKRFGMLNACMVLAPRGMLKASALQHKPGKKKIFLSLFKTLGLSKGLVFQATDKTEENDIKSIFGNTSTLFKTGNLPGKQKPYKSLTDKTPGFLKMVFVGRIHPIKNLDFLLRSIQGTKGEVELTVIATLEDRDYWKICQAIIEGFPPNIKVKILIDLPHDKIEEIIVSNHIFALPTKGENFGHAIFEAMAAGRPVLISDQTPWRNLVVANAGWDLSIENEDLFKDIVRHLVLMDSESLSTWCKGAWNHINKYLNHSDIKQSYLKLFS